MKKKCNLPRCYFHNYKDKHLCQDWHQGIGRSHLHTLHFIILFPVALLPELWVAVHRLLPVPTIYSHAKSCEIFFSFISTLRCCILYHSPLLVPAITAHLSRLWSCVQLVSLSCTLTVIMLPSPLMGLCAYQSTVFLCLLVYCNVVSMCGMCVHT